MLLLCSGAGLKDQHRNAQPCVLSGVDCEAVDDWDMMPIFWAGHGSVWPSAVGAVSMGCGAGSWQAPGCAGRAPLCAGEPAVTCHGL